MFLVWAAKRAVTPDYWGRKEKGSLFNFEFLRIWKAIAGIITIYSWTGLLKLLVNMRAQTRIIPLILDSLKYILWAPLLLCVCKWFCIWFRLADLLGAPLIGAGEWLTLYWIGYFYCSVWLGTAGAALATLRIYAAAYYIGCNICEERKGNPLVKTDNKVFSVGYIIWFRRL